MWCHEGRTGNRRKAYYDAGRKLLSLGRSEDALRMLVRAGELGDLEALVDVALYTLQGVGTPRDILRAVELLEAAYKRGAPMAANWLLLIYEGNLSLAAHMRDPMKATMWRYVPLVAADMSDLSPAWIYGQEMGLTDDQVREAHRRAVKWVAENLPPRRR